MTMVCAPAGFGKTTLLARWTTTLLEQKNIVAWLSVDAEDDDPEQFAAYLVAAFCRVSTQVGQQAHQLLTHDMLTRVDTVVSVLLNEIAACKRDVSLVLDDVDRLSSKPVLALVSRMLRYAPDNLHVLFGSRGDPAMLFGQLGSPERLTRLGVEDLRFSVEDAHTFFSKSGRIALDRSSVELLNSATEGWVAGLQVASLTLRAPSDAAKVAKSLTGARLGTDAYLDEAVLSYLPPPILDFLLRTSILDRLGAGVCDAVMGKGARSWQRLEWLEQHNVFIRPLDEERQWFRCHALMVDALRRRASRQLADELPLLHRRASQWLAAAGLWQEAVKHALAEGNLENAAQWVENCAMAMVEHGDAHTLLGWIAKLPPALIQRNLRIRTARALALAAAMENTAAAEEIESVAARIANSRGKAREKAEAALPEVNAVRALIAITNDESERSLEFGRAAAMSASSSGHWVTRLAMTAQIHGLSYAGQLEEARKVWRLTASTDDNPTPVFENAYREYLFALALLVHGEMAEALRFCEGVLPGIEQIIGRSSGVAAGFAGFLTSIYYERNDLSRARAIITERATVPMDSCPPSGLMRLMRTSARFLARDGDMDAALAIIEERRQLAVTRNALRLQVNCDAETVRILLLQGQLARARRIAEASSKTVPMLCAGRAGTFLETRATHAMLLARVLIAGNEAERAPAILATVRDEIAAHGWKYLDGSLSALLALAFERGDMHQQACVELDRALKLGASAGMINTFVDEGEPMYALLRRFMESSPASTTRAHAALVERLFAAFDGQGEPSPAESGDRVASAADVLSARELEILTCVARGLSNKEVARELQVTAETVKWHLKRIFDKLGVGSRIEAVQIGLQLSRRPD
ncbi:LuxR C-terminal-related transcriptional regulator [Paraburkholderia monticola]|uniref:LuxR C-terminal-related transcriptional regulator n=1 Tax=Paraburkholderia monticola TaxID=1399968 RepID=UPI0030C7051F